MTTKNNEASDNKILAVIYARVSKDDRNNATSSIEGQLQLGRERAIERGYEIIAEMHEDERGASGAIFDLPVLNEIREMARNGEFKVLIVRDLDRLARDLAKQLIIEQEFKRCRVEIEYVLDQFDDTAEGQFRKNVKAILAEYERQKIKQRMQDGVKRKLARGMIKTSEVPYGYRKTPCGNYFEIVEEEAKFVRLIFDMRVRNHSIPDIRRELERQNAPLPSKRSTHWTNVTINRIIARSVYYGKWSYGKRNGYNGKYNPEENWTYVDVPAIITRDQWQKAQRMIGKSTKGRKSKTPSILNRRIRCGICGCAMNTGGTKKYYLCPTKYQNDYTKECHLPHFSFKEVDQLCLEYLSELVKTPKIIRDYHQKQRAETLQNEAKFREHLADVDAVLQQHNERRERTMSLYIDGHITKDEVDQRVAELDPIIRQLERERKQIVNKLAPEITVEELEDFVKWVTRNAYLVERAKNGEASLDEKRELMQHFNVQAKCYGNADRTEMRVEFVCKLRRQPVSVFLSNASLGIRQEPHYLLLRATFYL